MSDYIITVDDDPTVSLLMQKLLGVESRSFPSIADLAKSLPDLSPRSVFIDIYLGTDENGVDALPQLREAWPYIPLIVITGKDSSEDISAALAAGANDFLRKPFNKIELRARYQARLRECERLKVRDEVQIGDIVINTRLRQLRGPSGVTFVAPSELELLLLLHSSGGSTVERDDIKRACWGDITVSDNTLDKKVHKVRSALKQVTPNLKIKTAYGQGFSLAR